jgi:hypothetical protein
MKKRLLAFLLVLVMVAGFVPVTARADGPVILEGSHDYNYVSDLSFYLGSFYDERTVVECDFDPAITEYHMDMITRDTINKSTLILNLSTSGLWYRFFVDGTAYSSTARERVISGDSLTRDMTYWLDTVWPLDGLPHVLTVQIGTKSDSNGDGKVNYKDDFDTSDVYNFHISNIPGLQTLSVSSLDNAALSLIPAFSQGGNARQFVIFTEEDAIKISASFSAGSTLLIGDETYTTALTNENIDLSAFQPNENGTVIVPLRLVDAYNSENTYTIMVFRENYYPRIAAQPQPITCDKDTAVTLSVTAEAPEGSSLSYQWYLQGPIDGATENTYNPDTSKAGTFPYYCIITNEVGGIAFATRSENAIVTVNLTYVNPPVILHHPGQETWSLNGGWIENNYQTTYPENTSFNEMFYCYERPETGVSANIVFYINNNPSYEGAQILDGTITPKLIGPEIISSFKTERLFEIGTYYVGCVITFTADADDTMTVQTASEFVELTFVEAPLDFEGAGTQSDPYKLQSAEDLVKLSAYSQSGKTFEYMYFKVTDDITLPEGWTSIGTGTTFCGKMDGNGKTITYVAGSRPLFEKVGATTIHDLTIYGEEINGCGLINGAYNGDDFLYLSNITLKAGSSTLKSGFAEGSARAASRIAFENCTVEPGVTIGYAKDQYGIGSFVNALVGTLTNCQSGAEVYGVSRVGGLAGSNANSVGLCTFTGCSFTGTVTATGNCAGGIIGRGYEDATAPNTRLIKIIDCTMSGTVSGVNNVGGLIGSEGGLQQSYDEASKGVVTGNTVTGTVTGTSNVGAIAGLYSHLDRYTVFENNTIPTGSSAFGKVYHVDTSAVAYGWHDGVFYFNSSATYTAAQLEEIYTALWTGWETSGRWKPSSLITGMERNDNPLNCDAVTETIAVTTMPTKTEYVTGEEFDPAGLVVTLTDLNGTTRELNANEYSLSGFSSNRPGTVTITVTFGTAVTTFEVTVTAPAGQTINVKLTVLGDTHHDMAEGDKGHGLWLGGLTTWLPETTYTVSANATVYDLICQAFDADPGLSMTAEWNNSYNTYYISSVTYNGLTLTEKDNHPNSGWMYTLNGANFHVQMGVSVLHLAEGDSIIMHWCDDYVADEAEGAAQSQYQQDLAAAIAVEDLIDAIGTPVTLESEDAIVAARTAYDALNDNAKGYVTNLTDLEAAEATLAELKAAAQADQEAANAVIALIAALPTEIALTDETAITEARAAYNALTDNQKALVTNIDTLTAAEAALAALHQAEIDQAVADAVIALINALPTEVALTDEAAITEARAAYNALTDAQKALVTNLDALTTAETALQTLQNEAAAGTVTDAIAALPAADAITLDDEAAVAAARAAYDALTPAQQALVDASALVAAENAINQLKAEAVTNLIAALPAADAVTLDNEADIAAARAAYDALTDAQKALVDASALVAAEARIAELKFGTVKPVVKAENDKKTGKIQLTITPVAGAVKYHILVSDKADGTYKEVAAITGTTYTYEGTPGTQYFFKVRAESAAGVLSAESAVVSLFRLPAQVTGLKVKSKKKKEVTLTWKKVTGAKKYVIYMSKNGKTGWKKIGTVKTNKFTYKKAPAGKKMYFRVQAVTANGKKGEFSKAVSVKVKK